VRTFLNGYQTYSNQVQIAVVPSNLQNTNLTIRINIGPTSNVSAVWVSWIAFSPASASFTAYGGSLSKNSFTGSVSNDISNSLYQNVYLLYGLTTISLNNQASLTYSCQINNNFQLSVQVNGNFDAFGLVYIVAGNSPNQLCSHCGSASYAYANSCLTACPLGTTPKSFPNGGIACLGTAVTTTTTSITSSTTTYISTGTTGTSTSGAAYNSGSSSTGSNSGLQSSAVNTQTQTSYPAVSTVSQTTGQKYSQNNGTPSST
jgi:hypothetical protein